MKNPFLGIKFIKSCGLEHVLNLLKEDYYKLPPITVEIDPDNRCNHNCIFCMYKEFRLRYGSHISELSMMQTIRELGDLGVKSITFTGGGEPLYNDEVFPNAFYHVTKNNMEVGLVTNGGLIHKYIDAINDNCKFVRISLDSASSKTHSKLHKSKDYSQILSNIDNIATSVDLGLAFLVHPFNYKEVLRFIELGSHLGVDYVEVRPVLVEGLKLGYNILTHVKDYIEQGKALYENEGFQVFSRMERFNEVLFKDRSFDTCLATPLVGVIGADMRVYLCCQTRGMDEYVLGSLYENTFKEIWLGKERRMIIKSLDVDKCIPCRYRNYNKILCDLRDCDHEAFL